jgi:hypothetical protein
LTVASILIFFPKTFKAPKLTIIHRIYSITDMVLGSTEAAPFGPVLNIAANSTIGKAGEYQALSLHQGTCKVHL